MISKPRHIIGSIARTLLAFTFLFSGFVKAIDPLGTTYKIEDYLHAFGGFFTSLDILAFPAAVALIAFEFVLGFCLLLNIGTRITSWLSLAMMCVMTPLTLYIAIANPVSDCGCFGDALVISNWATFFKNIVLLVLVVVLLVFRKHIPTTFTPLASWVLTSVAAVMVGGMVLYTMLHLPLIDFRPYKIDNNIPELMEIPENAEPDLYDVKFVYTRDGIERAFSIEEYTNLVKNDPSWVFVRQDSRLLKKGYEAPIHDFEIYDPDGEDITDIIIGSEEPVTLIVMYDLKKANLSQVAKINTLYAQANERGELFYILTGSGSDEIEGFASDNAIEAPICSCDPVTLKTIVRANPGALRVQNGVIIDKWNLRNR